MDQPPYPCPAEGALVTLLHPYGIDAWSRQQAVVTLGIRESSSPAYCPL